MQKVVSKGLKIDLHIHSNCSATKDGTKVKKQHLGKYSAIDPKA